MHRILVHLGPFTIYSYGVMFALAVVAGTYLAEKKSRKQGFPKDTIVDLSLWLLVSSVAGARILFVAANWDYYRGNILEIFKIWEGGLVYYGGLILGIFTAVYFLKRRKLPLWKVADILAPSVALSEAIGRIGCFLNGCCYGRISERWGVCFPAAGNPPVFDQQMASGLLAPEARFSLPVIPTQLYSAAASLAIFVILIKAERYKKFDGFLFWAFIFLYALSRLIIEGFRYYDTNFMLWDGITISQFISIILMIIACFFLLKGFKKYEKN